MNKNSPISTKEMIQAISSHMVFQGLDDHSLEKFEQIIEFKPFSKNKRIFEIGDQPNLIFYLFSGSLTLKFPDNSKLDLFPGEIIGEISVLSGDFRLGTLSANEDSQLITICGNKIFDPAFIPAETSLKIARKLGKRVANYLKSFQQTSTLELIEAGENQFVEFKSTLRWNIKANKKDKNITHAILKTIAAFLNSEGGILLIGVDDDGQVLGLDADRFENQDKLLLFLTNTIKSQIGTLHLDNIHFHVEKINGNDLLRIDIHAGNSPSYLSNEHHEHFYIRTGPSTTDLKVSKIYNYIKKRFGEQIE